MLRLIFLSLIAFVAWGYRSFAGGPLDGSTWEVRVRRQGLFALPRRDTLVFERGRFISSGHLEQGFLPGSYQAEGGLSAFNGLSDSWQASQESEREGSLHWRGRVEGERIEGTVTWIRTGGGVKTYAFHGRRKA